ncbi:hypothetical protein [Pararhizobium haloflavum]|uniref:hypothetical protein n=1 Tax=Pararhizobium haloflavum TaxID=2037914 RepID=UPI0012FFDA38|nr:hypothetical protein [Pararhizobium haloflavum]
MTSYRPIALLAGILLLGVAPTFAQSPFDEIEPAMPELDLPGLNQYAPTIADDGSEQFRTVVLEAKLTEDAPLLKDGLVWRVFDSVPGPDGKLPLVASSEGGSAEMTFPPGDYFLHVAFGRAAVSKKLQVPTEGPVGRQSITLNAGGLVLNARSGEDMRIPPGELSFSVYDASDGANDERRLVIADVKPDTVIGLNAGTYHVVSEYGDLNASIRSDIYIEAGKLTEATIQHRAAELTLKLVSERGGEAIADTAWSILTASGDPISESVGAFSTIILSEGTYTAVARNKDNVYQRDFTVHAGVNTDVEVMLSQ